LNFCTVAEPPAMRAVCCIMLHRILCCMLGTASQLCSFTDLQTFTSLGQLVVHVSCNKEAATAFAFAV